MKEQPLKTGTGFSQAFGAAERFHEDAFHKERLCVDEIRFRKRGERLYGEQCGGTFQ